MKRLIMPVWTIIAAMFWIGAVCALSGCDSESNEPGNNEPETPQDSTQYATYKYNPGTLNLDNDVHYTAKDDEYNSYRIKGALAESYLRSMYREGMTWQEAIYPKSAPEKYQIISYHVERCDSIDGLVAGIVFREWDRIGKFVNDNNSKVYFIDSLTGKKVLLYDFDEVRLASEGLYQWSYGRSDIEFVKFKDYEEWEKYDVFAPDGTGGMCAREAWCYDKRGGKVINSIGSTSGILSPIEEATPDSLVRELIQLGGENFLGLSPCDAVVCDHRIYYDAHLTTQLIKYLPKDFWKHPVSTK